MIGLRFDDIKHNSDKVLDMTSLTLEEFEILSPNLQEAFLEKMKDYCLDGKPRTKKKSFQTYKNCPLPTPEDRLLFVLSYIKSNALQVFHGQLFGMAQCKANVWIHILLPLLQIALKKRGDVPCRNMEELRQRLQEQYRKEEGKNDLVFVLPLHNEIDSRENTNPLFATTESRDQSRVPETRKFKRNSIAGRKNGTP